MSSPCPFKDEADETGFIKTIFQINQSMRFAEFQRPVFAHCVQNINLTEKKYNIRSLYVRVQNLKNLQIWKTVFITV
jgi:hypothetical protein